MDNKDIYTVLTVLNQDVREGDIIMLQHLNRLGLNTREARIILNQIAEIGYLQYEEKSVDEHGFNKGEYWRITSNGIKFIKEFQ